MSSSQTADNNNPAPQAALENADPTETGGPDAATTSSSTIPRKRKSITVVRKVLSRVLMPMQSCRDKTVTIIDQLKQNDSEFTQLKLDGSHAATLDFDRLCDAIRINKTVKNVQIHGGMIINIPLEKQEQLWHCIGKLPNLEELHFKYFLEFPLTLDGLNTALAPATNLKKLTIYDTVLYSRDYEDEVTNLSQHTQLKTIFFSQLRIPEGRVIDPILRSLVHAPNLSNLTVRIPRKRKGMVRNQTLSLLTNSKSLRILELRRLVLRDEQIVQIAKEVETNTIMKEVTIQCDDCLKTICCDAISTMLPKNKCLTRLEIWGQKVEEDGFVNVINSLQKNNTLKVLHLSHDIGERGNAALAEMLKHNQTMETLYMRSFGDPEKMARTDYYLKLNATGLRGYQLDLNMNRQSLVDKLAKHSDEINHTYFLLRGNPNFLLTHQNQDMTPIVEEVQEDDDGTCVWT